MKAASLAQIKKELKLRSYQDIEELCLRLGRFKKENKELLTYLLYEVSDELSFINSIKDEIDLAFKEINRTSYYYLKKSIRKILRNTKKNIRYSKKKQTEVELILFYCNKLKNLSPPISKSIPLTRIFEREILRVEKIVAKLDADLQYDYGNEIEIIRNE